MLWFTREINSQEKPRHVPNLALSKSLSKQCSGLLRLLLQDHPVVWSQRQLRLRQAWVLARMSHLSLLTTTPKTRLLPRRKKVKLSTSTTTMMMTLHHQAAMILHKKTMREKKNKRKKKSQVILRNLREKTLVSLLHFVLRTSIQRHSLPMILPQEHQQ